MDKETALLVAREIRDDWFRHRRKRGNGLMDFIEKGSEMADGYEQAISERDSDYSQLVDDRDLWLRKYHDEKAKFEDQRNHFNRDLADSGRAEYVRGIREGTSQAIKDERESASRLVGDFKKGAEWILDEVFGDNGSPDGVHLSGDNLHDLIKRAEAYLGDQGEK